MGQKLPFDKDNTAILLFRKSEEMWVEKSFSISALFPAYYYKKFTGYDIYFKGTDGKFFYPAEKVVFLTKLKNVDISKLDVYVDGRWIDAIKLEKFERDYYRVHCKNNVLFTKNVIFKSNKHRDIFAYYAKLAEYAEEIAEPETPLYYFAKNYRRIDPSDRAVLNDFLKGEIKPAYNRDLVLVPFDFNQSQITAIDHAFKSSISVIEGPPGTGKTQTILNLIANILHRNNNCAVVSNNNTAIANVREKMDEDKWSFIAASLGSLNNVNLFFENNGNDDLDNFLKKTIGLSPYAASDFDVLCHVMKKIQETEVDNARLEVQLFELEKEMQNYACSSFEKLRMNPKLDSDAYLLLVARLQEAKKIRLFERWKLSIKYRIKIASYDLEVLLANAEWLFYTQKIKEVKKRIGKNKQFIEENKRDEVMQKLRSLSRTILTQDIQKHFEGKDLKKFEKDSYKKDFSCFLERYPVILSTSQSLLNNVPKNFIFDYLIIDEASQGDLLSSILAMSCAKNLIVVGDSRQLQQIDEERLFEKSRQLAQDFAVPQCFRYESNSILKSVKEAIPNVPTTLLKEHYRCAPDIINFCNRMFYNNELVPMTHNEGQHIEIIKTVPGNHARKNPNGSGLYNQREIDEIGKIIEKTPDDDIGIISPFRYQADLLHQQYPNENIEADTVHKFQGRQKDKVILSFVVNSLEKSPENIENRLFDFVTNEKLFNVALSRGKKKVTLVVSDKVYHSSNNVVSDFIGYAEYLYGNQITHESKVTSVFDFLYSEYTAQLLSLYRNQKDEHYTELLMADAIQDVLKNYPSVSFSMHTRLSKIVPVVDGFSEEETRYILHPWTHVDFLFFNAVSKKVLFVIEVDGIQYHEQDKKQSDHDEIKNRILTVNQIPIYRFKTNGSDEKQRLISIIDTFAH